MDGHGSLDEGALLYRANGMRRRRPSFDDVRAVINNPAESTGLNMSPSNGGMTHQHSEHLGAAGASPRIARLGTEEGLERAMSQGGSRLGKRGRSPSMMGAAAAADGTSGGGGGPMDSPYRKNSYEQHKSKLTSVSKMAEGLTAVQEHENELAEVVVVCEPEQASLMMGGLHPRGSLFERPVNIVQAKAQHAAFRDALRSQGLKVMTVKEILAYKVEENISYRVDLEDLAFSALQYKMETGSQVDDLAEADRKYVSDDYKREVVEHMSVQQLVDTILINPTVSITPSLRDTGLAASYTFHPLSNLVYTRDQQITTCKGVVMGRLRSQQRQCEVQVMSFCFHKLGLPVIGRISDPGYLEGGDFFPCGQDLAMLGIGLRSNLAACQQLMDKDLLGTRRFAVVRDDFDKHQDRMHLDCVFSIIGDNLCIMLEDIMGPSSPKRRLVDEYVRDPETGKYKIARAGLEFSQFIRSEGYEIIPIKHEHQLAYACNVLNLGEGRLISVHAPSARQIAKSPFFKGDITVIDFSSITSMYGSVHCASQVVRRVPRRFISSVWDE